jgi:dihydrofolate synthase/folylpolyglutamate synthase
LDLLEGAGFSISEKDVVSGWSKLFWPARVEVFGRAPMIVIDGAHNVASAEALAETLRTCFPDSPRTLVFGTTREKDTIGQLRALTPLFDRVIATRYLENPRSVPPEEIAAAVQGVPVEIAAGPREALDLARRRTGDDGLVVVTGSLFLAAEARALLLSRSQER